MHVCWELAACGLLSDPPNYRDMCSQPAANTAATTGMLTSSCLPWKLATQSPRHVCVYAGRALVETSAGSRCSSSKCHCRRQRHICGSTTPAQQHPGSSRGGRPALTCVQHIPSHRRADTWLPWECCDWALHSCGQQRQQQQQQWQWPNSSCTSALATSSSARERH